MVMKWTVVYLVTVATLGHLCNAQFGHYAQKPAQTQRQDTKRHDPVQAKQTFETALVWAYPVDPQPDPKATGPFELRSPVPANSVAVECRETVAHVEVKMDMFGVGQFINSADLTLGSCAAVAVDNQAHVLIYQSGLHECNSRLAMTGNALVYTFTLNYNPRALAGAPVLRTTAAAVIVECYYPRNHNVSSNPLDPSWIPFSATKVAEEFLYFTLKLMTDDWQFERPVYQYFLGDMINIETTVKVYYHVNLRVYVDYCVATLAPEPTSDPRYKFIENNGCFIDAKITGSASKFIARTEDPKLQFQLEAFRFQGAASGLMYITCHLKATSATYLIDTNHRACSFMNGWKEASGVDNACGTCDSGSSGGGGGGGGGGGYGGGGGGGGGGSVSHHARKVRQADEVLQVEWEGDVTLGPIQIKDREIA